jgi:hypothetical protein
VNFVLVHEQCLALTSFDPPVDYSYPSSCGGRTVTRQVKTVSIYHRRGAAALHRNGEKGGKISSGIARETSRPGKSIAIVGIRSGGTEPFFSRERTDPTRHPGPWGCVPACQNPQAELRAVAWHGGGARRWFAESSAHARTPAGGDSRAPGTD